MENKNYLRSSLNDYIPKEKPSEAKPRKGEACQAYPELIPNRNTEITEIKNELNEINDKLDRILNIIEN